MSYDHRVLTVLVLFLATGACGIGALLGAARSMAAQDLHIGHGSSKFPPQGVAAGAPRTGGLRAGARSAAPGAGGEAEVGR